MNLKKLCAKILEVNIKNGWNVCQPGDWQDENKVPAKLALVHSEIDELRVALNKDDLKNIGEELADIFIRVLDLTSLFGGFFAISESWIPRSPEELATYLVEMGMSERTTLMDIAYFQDTDLLHFLTTKSLEYFRKHKEMCIEFVNVLESLLSFVVYLAERHELSIQKEVDDKIERNRHRGYRYGGKRI